MILTLYVPKAGAITIKRVNVPQCLTRHEAEEMATKEGALCYDVRQKEEA